MPECGCSSMSFAIVCNRCFQDARFRRENRLQRRCDRVRREGEPRATKSSGSILLPSPTSHSPAIRELEAPATIYAPYWAKKLVIQHHGEIVFILNHADRARKGVMSLCLQLRLLSIPAANAAQAESRGRSVILAVGNQRDPEWKHRWGSIFHDSSKNQSDTGLARSPIKPDS